MPELPEVETIRRSLLPELVGQQIMRVRYNRANIRFPLPVDMPAQVEEKTIVGLQRRGKYLLMQVEDAGDVLIHLGMSGRLLVETGARSNTAGEFYYDILRHVKHDHVVVEFENSHLIYNDPRRFGVIDFIPLGQNAPHKLLAGMGLEPWDDACTGAWLFETALNRSTNLKAFLLDQTIIAGIGNIYASEALHLARLSPFRAAGSLNLQEAETLMNAVRAVLEKAIKLGGSTIRDFQNSDGTSGGMQDEFLTYGRDGKPCLQCGGMIEKAVQNGRSTFWCGLCQI